jgi:hypothetical protein
LRDKEDVYNVVKAAVSALGRSDEPHSYGVAEDREAGRPIIYFDLPRISPLQFNVYFESGTGREAIVELVIEKIKQRLRVQSGANLLFVSEQPG